MADLDKRLRAYGRSSISEPNESKVKDTVVSAGKNFYEGMEKSCVSYFDFLFDQTRYIHKRWWILQFFVLVLAGWFAHEVKDVQWIQRMFGITSSLFGIMIIPEFWKNRSSNSMEVESAAYFSVRQIYSARLLAFAVVDGALLGLFATVLTMSGRVIVEEIVIQFFLPMMVTCCICFRCLSSHHMASEYAACFLSLLWTAVWIQIVLNDSVYQAVSAPIWVGVCGMTVIYLTYTVKRVLRESCLYL